MKVLYKVANYIWCKISYQQYAEIKKMWEGEYNNEK